MSSIVNNAARSPLLSVAVYAVVIVIVLAPLAFTLVVPLVDYPNHLAKIFLAINLPDNQFLNQFYEWRLRLVPNLAQDVIVPPLARIIGTYEALRLFLAWSLIQIVLGVCLLRYALLRQIGFWPLASVLFLYNQALWWGLLNYLFASGLVLIFFAVWILMERRSNLARVAVFMLIMGLMFFLHLIATAVLAFSICTYQLGRMWHATRSASTSTERRKFYLKEFLVAAVPLFPVLFLWTLSPTGSKEALFIHKGIANIATGILSPFMMTGSKPDLFFAIAVFFFGFLAFSRGYITLAKPLIFTCVSLAIVAVLMPMTVLGVFGAHYRVPFLLGCILLAGIQVQDRNVVFSKIAVLVIGGLLLLRGILLTVEWDRFDDRVNEYRAAIASIEPGSKVMPVMDSQSAEDWIGAQKPPIFWHLSALVVLEASAFDPLVFSDPQRQSITVRENVKHIDAFIGQPLLTKLANKANSSAGSAPGQQKVGPGPSQSATYFGSKSYNDYDYLIRFSYKSPRDKLYGPLKLLKTGAWFDLYRIEK